MGNSWLQPVTHTAEAIEAAPAEHVAALRAQQARAWLAAGDIPAAKAALEAVKAERPEDLSELGRARLLLEPLEPP